MKIKLIDGSDAEINIVSEEAKKHFADPHNYTKEILAQFEQGIYKDFITKEDRIIFDFGANVGLFSLHVSPYADVIYAVEPTPEHMRIQKEVLVHVSVPMLRHIEHIEAALSDHIGTTKFYWCGVNTTMNSLQPRGDREFIVACVDLQNIINVYNIVKVDFCKIDIEGSEWTAITEATLKPVYDKINKIFVELHPPTIESQEVFKKVFEGVGYKVNKVHSDALFCYK